MQQTSNRDAMPETGFLLYGANGYTGQLIARLAKIYNLRPTLAARNEEALESLAGQLNLPYQVIDLNDTAALELALSEHRVVIHAAGPFDATATQMVEACIKTQTHYLDINGDIRVFEMLKEYDALAKDAGIMMMPGAGFDVVPTDCVALMLKDALPDATDLKLAFVTAGGGLSKGTATTMINNLGNGGSVRKNGKIINVPLGQHGFTIKTGDRSDFVMSIPWGDVSTAYHTTGIPNIETYTGVPRAVYGLLKLQFSFNWLLRKKAIRKYLQNKVNQRIPGPTDEMRSKARSIVWGQAHNDSGQVKTIAIRCPDGYTLTAHSTLIIVQKVLNGLFKTGYQTPASAYGAHLVFEIPGTKKEPV